MGGICSKGLRCNAKGEVSVRRDSAEVEKSFKRHFTLSRREDEVTVVGIVAVTGADGEQKQFPAAAVGVRSKLKRVNAVESESGKIFSVPNGFSGEHAAAGWPSWLTSVAAEAVSGWIPRKEESFEQLDKIGQGTYSSVYRARDLDTGKIVALKKVRFVNMEPESVRFMAREIQILRRLDHPNVIKLQGLVVTSTTTTISSGTDLFLVFDYMEHDLAGIAALPETKFTEPQVKCLMRQVLSGLEHCHERGVLHRDMKGSNLLIDDNGVLKIADFGLARVFNPNPKIHGSENEQHMTSRVVTLWYRPPELLLGATDYGAGVDLWSAGCILAELLKGKPIMPGRTEVEQMHKIYKLCGSPSEQFWKTTKLPHATLFKPQHPYKRCLKDDFKDFSPPALTLLDRLLSMEPSDRGTATTALNSPFFTTKPLACEPSTFPKYPPSKEIDAKLRAEEARRKREAAKAQARVGSMAPREKVEEGEESSAEKEAQRKPKSSSIKNKNDAHEHGRNSDNSLASLQPRLQETQKSTPERSLTILGRSNTKEMRTQKSHLGGGGGKLGVAGGFALFSGLEAARSGVAKSDKYTETVKKHNPRWPERRLSNRYNHVDLPGGGGGSALSEAASSHKKEDVSRGRIATVSNAKKSRLHYSGPLIPAGGDMEEMLKEHEKQIQEAVRNARLDREKTNSRKTVSSAR